MASISIASCSASGTSSDCASSAPAAVVGSSASGAAADREAYAYASLTRDLRRALADRATPFPEAAARILATAFGAWGADLLPADPDADAGPLASYRAPGAAPAGDSAEAGACKFCLAAAADEDCAPCLLVSLFFDGEEARQQAQRSPALRDAAALAAAGIEARRLYPLEAVARVVRPGPHDSDVFTRAAAAIRESLAAARCYVLIEGEGAGPPRILGASPHDAGPAPLLPPAAWEDLRRGVRFREGPLRAEPIRHRGRLLGALVAEAAPGRALEGQLEEALATCAWGLAAAVRDLDRGPAGAAARRGTPGPEPFWEAPQDETARSYRLLAGITQQLNTVLDTADLEASLRMVCGAFSAERAFVYKLVGSEGPDGSPSAAQPVAEFLASAGLPSHTAIDIPAAPEDRPVPLIYHLLTNFACSVRNVALFQDVQVFVATSPIATESMRRRAEAARTRSSLLALCLFSGTPVGYLGVETVTALADWTLHREGELLRRVAEAFGVAIAHARLFEQHREQNRALGRKLLEQSLMARLGHEINDCSGVQAIFDRCAELVCQFFSATRMAMMEFIEFPHVFGQKFDYNFTEADAVRSAMTPELLTDILASCERSPNGVYLRTRPDFDEGAQVTEAMRRHKQNSQAIMIAPTYFNGAINGMLSIERVDAAADWGEAETGLLRRIAEAIGTAMAHGRMQEQIAKQNARLQREVRDKDLLQEIVREISQDVGATLEHILGRTAELVGRALSVQRCCIWLYKEPLAVMPPPTVMWRARDDLPVEIASGILDRDAIDAMERIVEGSPDGVLCVSDLREFMRAAAAGLDAARRASCEAYVAEHPTKSSMSTFIKFRGRREGYIIVEMLEARREWGPDEALLLRRVADHCAMAIAHGRVLEAYRAQNAALERQLMHSGLLEAITKEVHQVLSVDEVFRTSVVLLRDAFKASRVRMTSLEDFGLEAIAESEGFQREGPSAEELAAISARDPNKREAYRRALTEFAETLSEDHERLQNVVAVRDCEHFKEDFERAGINSPILLQMIEDIRSRIGVKAFVCAFTSFRGRANGVITVSQLETRRWTEDETRLLQTVAEQIGIAIAQSKLLAQEQRQRELLAQQNTALEAARTAADAASRAKSQFLAMISHEIRTPMNALCNMSEFLLETELSPQQREFSSTIHTSSLALLNILNDILDASRLEYDHVQIRRAPFALGDLLQQVAELMAPSAFQKGIDLTWHVARGCPPAVHSDDARLRQICVNVVGNAIKFTNEGEVSLTARVEGGSLLVDIADSGIGISEEGQRKLFSWFYQVDTSHARKYNGTGLGLFISRKLAELLGGELTVRSDPGRGSVFTLALPLDAVALAPLLPAREQPPGPPASDEGRPLAGRTVALCTLSDVTRALVGDALEAAGAVVVPFECPSGEHPPADCVVIDIAPHQSAETFRVPRPADCGGGGLLESAGPPPPCVAMAPHGSARLEVIRKSCAAVVSKPAKPRSLVAAVAAALATDGGPLPPSPPLAASASAPPAVGRASPSFFPAAPRRSLANVGVVPRDLRILVVEDVEVNRRIVMCMLERRGYTTVAAASNGREALEAARAAAAGGAPFQCVLLDIMMPVMDGFEAARHIRAELPAGTQPHIVALTANAMAGDREACLAAGFDDYLSKPMRKEELMAALQRCAERLLRGREVAAAPAPDPASASAETSTGS